jgi:hypothetical protein
MGCWSCRTAVFWVSGFVSAQLQGSSNLRLRRRPIIGTTRQKPKILAAHRYLFSVNALNIAYESVVELSHGRFRQQIRVNQAHNGLLVKFNVICWQRHGPTNNATLRYEMHELAETKNRSGIFRHGKTIALQIIFQHFAFELQGFGNGLYRKSRNRFGENVKKTKTHKPTLHPLADFLLANVLSQGVFPGRISRLPAESRRYCFMSHVLTLLEPNPTANTRHHTLV